LKGASGFVWGFALLIGLTALAALPSAHAGENRVILTYSSTLLTESAAPEILRQIADFEKANPGIKADSTRSSGG
jgi:hypothetical protein